MRITLIASLGAAAVGATELPIDDLAKLGVAGSCMGLVWYLVARSLPAIIKTHAENLKALTDAYQQSVADLRQLHRETNGEIVKALGEVKQAIKEGDANELSHLKQLVLGQKKSE